MDKNEYLNLVNKKYPKEHRIKNMFIAFIIGGLIGLCCQILSYMIMVCFGISQKTSYMIVALILIFLSSLFTGLGFFDDWAVKAKCGIFIPTTGFAHSLTSAALDYKKDGAITGLGANFFKLAGSVILYGIISAFFLCILKVVFYG